MATAQLPVISVDLPDAVYLIQFCNALSRLTVDAVTRKDMGSNKVTPKSFLSRIGVLKDVDLTGQYSRRKIPAEKRERLCHARSYHKFRLHRMLLKGRTPMCSFVFKLLFASNVLVQPWSECSQQIPRKGKDKAPYTNGGDSPQGGGFGMRPGGGAASGGPNRPAAGGSNEEYVSKFNYDAMKDDEMSLVKGMRIHVLQIEGDGWWLGQNADSPSQQGWFPSNYVTPSNNAAPVTSPQNDVITVVRTLYAFNSGNPEELAFEQDEVLDIIQQPAEDPEWWMARNSSGETGLVPKNYVETEQRNYDPVNSLASPTEPVPNNPPPPHTNGSSGMGDWFFGKISRQEAERLLEGRAQTGEFLVRDSETATGFSISMKMPGRIRHFKVSALPNGEYGIGQRKFESLEALIAHYKRAPIYTSPEQGKAYLTTPLSH
uniref:Cytoplasmic protein NCK2 n=1 Tax=Phallusia mammillata TaxID=59560 RepID=A0A6F9DM70_9ASCI|nr:cytoplasmic protein NCK2 [Phallusia mammillata]